VKRRQAKVQAIKYGDLFFMALVEHFGGQLIEEDK
jgi:hypothetical protein